ncbi:hypothetical protein [Levilactobacillus fujinensis]|uniref:DUF3784 domain-containing protein n=1 Tax=Levilactobacillus fujinensis TaxID=2486024 RepID=A0ABW1TGQ7_9LACO|nr:hypothetical protein [Levilactobacillus fujinensis]
MAITILMICYTLISFGLGWYFFSHRQRPFLVFHPEESRELQRVLSIGGILMMIIGVFSAAATIMNNTIFLAAVLLVGVIAIMAIQLILLHWFPKG